jgi:hypothetical protein
MVVEDKELAVTMKKTNKKAPPPLPAVKLASLWALLTVAIFLGSFVAPLLIPHPVTSILQLITLCGSILDIKLLITR